MSSLCYVVQFFHLFSNICHTCCIGLLVIGVYTGTILSVVSVVAIADDTYGFVTDVDVVLTLLLNTFPSRSRHALCMTVRKMSSLAAGYRNAYNHSQRFATGCETPVTVNYRTYVCV
ncbi:hypothetical protein OH76DRAFT_436045 [Lentinus brumalis]|uniref:Uncharacterized protein n=1 Tax=Lentinus brumalis TaxID=2498619 RepID=A0A371DDW4_9APHY|nr:hypothetical protein OH76DRAFT_436045 [Polyporus brumalis]